MSQSFSLALTYDQQQQAEEAEIFEFCEDPVLLFMSR